MKKHRDREIENKVRETERQGEQQTKKQAESDTPERNTMALRQRDKETEVTTYKKTDTYTDAKKLLDKHTVRQTDRETNR